MTADQMDLVEESEGRVALLEADPDLARHVVAADAERARRTLTVPMVQLAAGEFEPEQLFPARGRAFGALVISGLVLREVSLGGQPTLVLLGPGDLIYQASATPVLLSLERSWAAAAPVGLALLDDRFLKAVRAWPRLLTGLVDRAASCQDGLLLQLAISQQPRVEDRLVALLRHLGERWGRMTPAGVLIGIRLTHEALGRIVGARRPTVTLALKALAGENRVRRNPDGTWLLCDFAPTAPSQLVALKGTSRPALVDSELEPAPPCSPRLPADLHDELRWLRDLHADLRLRVDDLRMRSASNCEHSRAVLQTVRARRGLV